MERQIDSLIVTATSLVNASGIGEKATLNAMRNNSTGLRNTGYPGVDFDTWLGKVDAVDTVELEEPLKHFSCRNHKLAKLGLDTDNFRERISVAIEKYGSNRIGVFMGTSTSGKAELEKAYKHRDDNNGKLPMSFNMLNTHNIGSVQDYVQHSLGLDGAGMTISTACSSSAKVFVTAYRFIKAGICDAAVIGGVDSLCLTTFYGFKSLQLIDSELCRPWDINRKGINIGEAAGFALIEKDSDSKQGIRLKGYGESSDAYHMSTPHPEGNGAIIAMQTALLRAGLKPDDIDYVNLHGTATHSNDAAEAQGLVKTFPDGVTCSSTKGITGHTLGAAGITEAVISMLVLKHGVMPGTVNLKNQDPDLPVNVLLSSLEKSANNVMSNSFGFGGTNCSLVFGW